MATTKANTNTNTNTNETGLTKNQIISQLARSTHGKLIDYAPVARTAATQEPEFLAHLIAWNARKGQVRDSKVALPVLALANPALDAELSENAIAHIASLGPRELLRAYRFALETRPVGYVRKLRSIITRYLRELEANRQRWNRVAVQHRAKLKELYALTHTKPSTDANAILFQGFRPTGSVFETIATLSTLSPEDAAQAITQKRIPFLIAVGALGAKAKEPALIQALIERMSATELVTNTKMLEKLGMKSSPQLRGAYDAALQRASTSKANTLKTSRAAEAVSDPNLREKLRGLQEKQASAISVEGDWLVLADKSGSMAHAIKAARQVAATLARLGKGKVTLTFFDTMPQTVDVTNLPLDSIEKATRHITAGGGTSIGCGLRRALDTSDEYDGIVVVSDAAENTTPMFADMYTKYSEKFGKEIPVYLYRIGNAARTSMFNYSGDIDLADSMRRAGHEMQEFALSNDVDFYSLPNLVQTMRTNRYSLVDEVMATPLLTLDDVFKAPIEEEVTV